MGEIPDIQQISRRIRVCSLDRGWDEVELARRAKLSRTTLYYLRMGKSRHPRRATLNSLAAAFELSLEQFLWGEPSDHERGLSLCSETSSQFNRKTNREIERTQATHPHLFRNWTAQEWDELYSTFGVGGALSSEGVIANAQGINQSRETRRQLNMVLETHLNPVAVQMIESLYRMVIPEGNLAPGADLQALIEAHVQEANSSSPESSVVSSSSDED